MAGKAILAALMQVQSELKAPKGQRNTFGKYNYRSAEDIFEAVKPLLKANGLYLRIADAVELIGDRHYIKATATIADIATGDEISTTAYAREPLDKKGMDASQVTGATSSYARKYALNGLFGIDDTKDADTDEYARQTAQDRAHGKGTGEGGAGNTMRGAMRALAKEMDRIGVTKEGVAAICGEQFQKTSARDLTLAEMTALAQNLESWTMEKETV